MKERVAMKEDSSSCLQCYFHFVFEDCKNKKTLNCYHQVVTEKIGCNILNHIRNDTYFSVINLLLNLLQFSRTVKVAFITLFSLKAAGSK